MYSIWYCKRDYGIVVSQRGLCTWVLPGRGNSIALGMSFFIFIPYREGVRRVLVLKSDQIRNIVNHSKIFNCLPKDRIAFMYRIFWKCSSVFNRAPSNRLWENYTVGGLSNWSRQNGDLRSFLWREPQQNGSQHCWNPCGSSLDLKKCGGNSRLAKRYWSRSGTPGYQCLVVQYQTWHGLNLWEQQFGATALSVQMKSHLKTPFLLIY